MAMNILSISNTQHGSFDERTDKFTPDEDRAGRTIYSSNRFKIKTTPDSVCPSQISASQITELVAFAKNSGSEVSIQSGVSYDLHRKEDLDAVDDNGVVKPPATSWYYRPTKAPMGKFNFSKK